MRKLYLYILLLAVSVSPSYAGLIFSNLGPGDSHVCCGGWTLGYGSEDWTQGDAFHAVDRV